MRKALLVIALIGASFAGGAVVNGPGLQHAKAWLADQLVDSPRHGGGDGTGEFESDPFPTADVPSIQAGDEGAPVVSSPPAEPVPEAKTQENPPAQEAAKPAAEPAKPAPEPATAQTTAPAPAATAAPPLTPPAAATPDPAPPAGPGEVAAPPVPQAAAPAGPAPFGDAPDSKAPAQAVVPPPASGAAPGGAALAAASEPAAGTTAAPAAPVRDVGVKEVGLPALPPPATPASTTTTAAAGGWADVQRRLNELGVTQYWVEGGPGGAVKFRCAIPVAGEHSVAQQFEAEGDDPIQAADTVLRRVTLWRMARATP